MMTFVVKHIIVWLSSTAISASLILVVATRIDVQQTVGQVNLRARDSKIDDTGRNGDGRIASEQSKNCVNLLQR